MLFLRGASELTRVSGLSLRKCLVAEQLAHALAPHPQYAAHVAGPARWDRTREGAVYARNRWISS